MKVKELFEEVLEEEVLTEAKISELLQKDAKLLTKSELNQLAKFKYNFDRRGSKNRPTLAKLRKIEQEHGEKKADEAWAEHEKKYKDIIQKIDQKLRAANYDSGVVTSSRGYYR